MKRDTGEVKPYLQSEDSKKEQVRRMFDGIAPHYDSLNTILSAGFHKGWRRKAGAKMGDKPRATIVDIACGTGDFAFSIADKFPDSKITGLDIAPRMLDIAKQKSQQRGYAEQVTFVHGDSENLPFASNSFDGATVGFGVRNFGDLQTGLQEIHRVLSDDGVLIVLEFTKPRFFPFKQMFGAYFKYVLPMIGGAKSGDSSAYRYLYDSVQAFPDYDKFINLLTEVGFKRAEYQVLSLGICAVYSAYK